MNSGKPSRSIVSRRELGARDRRIVDDVIRLRLITNETIQRLYLPGAKPNATVKVTSRLVKSGWLKPFVFAAKTQYFVAGMKTIRSFGLPTSRCRPLGPQALATQLALVAFVATTTPRLRVLTDKEIANSIANTTKQHRSLCHAIETNAVNDSLRLIRVDLGGTPAHVGKKLESDVGARVGNAYYANLIGSKRLVLVVLTPTATKKSLIETAIRKRSWPNGLRFTVTVTPVLAQLIGDT